MHTLKLYWSHYLDSYKGLSKSIWILALVMFVNQTGTMVLPFMGVYLTTQLGFTLEQAGIVLSTYGVGTLLGSVMGGWLTDRFNSFKIQTFSLFGIIPVYAIFPLFKSFTVICVAIFLLSLIKDIFRPANSAAISRYAKPENLTRAFSLNRMAINLGFSIGPAIGGFLAVLSYDFLFYVNALFVLAAALIFVFYFSNKDAKPVQKATQPSGQAIKIKSAYTDGKFLLFSLFIAFYAFCFFQILNALPLFYKQEAGMHEQNVGLILAFNGIVVFVLEMFLVNVAERKLSITATMIIGTLCCGFGYLVLIPSSTYWVLYLSMFLISISEILVMPFSSTLAVARSVPENRGSYMGLNSMAFSTAFITSPYLGLMITQQLGFQYLWSINFALILIATVGLYFTVKHLRR